MNLTDYFFKTTFSPNQYFNALREDSNKDKIGFSAFALSIGLQVAIDLFGMLIFMGSMYDLMSWFLFSMVASKVILNIMILVVAHYGINQGANGKSADWPLIMAMVGISSLPLIISSALTMLLPFGYQFFSILGLAGMGVVLGLGAHIIMGLQKEAALIITPILIILISYGANLVNSILYI